MLPIRHYYKDLIYFDFRVWWAILQRGEKLVLIQKDKIT